MTERFCCCCCCVVNRVDKNHEIWNFVHFRSKPKMTYSVMCRVGRQTLLYYTSHWHAFCSRNAGPQVHFFSIRVIEEWNSLPVELINCNTVESSKKGIDCYFRNRDIHKLALSFFPCDSHLRVASWVELSMRAKSCYFSGTKFVKTARWRIVCAMSCQLSCIRYDKLFTKYSTQLTQLTLLKKLQLDSWNKWIQNTSKL